MSPNMCFLVLKIIHLFISGTKWMKQTAETFGSVVGIKIGIFSRSEKGLQSMSAALAVTYLTQRVK